MDNAEVKNRSSDSKGDIIDTTHDTKKFINDNNNVPFNADNYLSEEDMSKDDMEMLDDTIDNSPSLLNGPVNLKNNFKKHSCINLSLPMYQYSQFIDEITIQKLQTYSKNVIASYSNALFQYFPLIVLFGLIIIKIILITIENTFIIIGYIFNRILKHLSPLYRLHIIDIIYNICIYISLVIFSVLMSFYSRELIFNTIDYIFKQFAYFMILTSCLSTSNIIIDLLVNYRYNNINNNKENNYANINFESSCDANSIDLEIKIMMIIKHTNILKYPLHITIIVMFILSYLTSSNIWNYNSFFINYLMIFINISVPILTFIITLSLTIWNYYALFSIRASDIHYIHNTIANINNNNPKDDASIIIVPNKNAYVHKYLTCALTAPLNISNYYKLVRSNHGDTRVIENMIHMDILTFWFPNTMTFLIAESNKTSILNSITNNDNNDDNNNNNNIHPNINSTLEIHHMALKDQSLIHQFIIFMIIIILNITESFSSMMFSFVGPLLIHEVRKNFLDSKGCLSFICSLILNSTDFSEFTSNDNSNNRYIHLYNKLHSLLSKMTKFIDESYNNEIQSRDIYHIKNILEPLHRLYFKPIQQKKIA